MPRMASVVPKCDRCNLPYNTREREVLGLPCLHRFCKSCLLKDVRAGRRQCHICGKDWSHASMDKLKGNQLIPLQSSAAAAAAGASVCAEHREDISFWCETCQKAVCLTCVVTNHSQCTKTPIKEKRIMMREVYMRTLSINASLQSAVRYLQAKVTEAELILKENEDKLAVDMAEFKKSGSVTKLEELVQNLQDGVLPSACPSLIARIAGAFQEAHDGEVKTFISKMNQKKQSLDKYFSSLKSGESWTIADRMAAATAAVFMKYTPARPSAVIVTWSDWQDHQLELISETIPGLPLTLSLQLDDFYAPAEMTAGAEYAMEVILRHGDRCKLVKLWGNLGVPTINKLPSKLASVGLVLACSTDQEKMGALLNRLKKGRLALLKEIHLCVVHPHELKGGQFTTQDPDIVDCLHLPRVGQETLDWMKTLAGSRSYIQNHRRTVEGPRFWQKLYLPGCSLSAHDVLSALTDLRKKDELWLLPMEVHLPADPSLPDTERVQLDKKYLACQCPVQWDLDSL